MTKQEKKIKKNHDILLLLDSCIEIDSSFELFRKNIFADLDDIGMSVRYDDIQNDPGEKEAFEFIELAKEIKDFVEEKLKIGNE